MSVQKGGRLGNWLPSWLGTLFSHSVEFKTVRSDGIPWKIIPGPDRVVAIGDLHGNLDALARILEDRELIDSRISSTEGAPSCRIVPL